MESPSDILNSFKELPAMPNVIVHALNIMKDPDSGANDLAKVVSYDQSLCTKVLTLVNSAYYGFSQQVTSVARAISLIGMTKAKNIIMTVAMRPMLTSQGDKLLWEHSITTAVGCEYIAKYLKIIDVDEAFVIGFLHDIGKTVLRLKDAKTYEQVRSSVSFGQNIIDVERKYYGVDHCVMGSLLAKKWQLPLLLNNTIKYHHNPTLSSIPLPCALINVVDTLVKDDFSNDKLDKNITSILNFNIDEPSILKDNISSKAGILLRELSN